MSDALATLRDVERRLRLDQSDDLILALVNAAAVALEQASSPGEIKDIGDRLRGIETYLKRQHAELVQSNLVVAQRLRTERALGRLIPEQFPQGAHSPNGGLSEYGIGYMQSHRWQQYAAIDDQDFELWVQERLETDELTGAGLLRLWGLLFGQAGADDWQSQWDRLGRLLVDILTNPETPEVARELCRDILKRAREIFGG